MERVNFEKELNKEQLKAVFHEKGPAIVLAGAGTGKTRVLIYRIIYLLSKGIAPDRILALTFTNKAADEMKERIKNYLKKEKTKMLWMGTFHSIGLRIIKENYEKLKLEKNFVIYDREDSEKLLKTIIDQEDNTKEWIKKISRIRHKLYYPDKYETEIVKKYIKSLRKNNALDFDDLLLLVIELFKKHPDVREYYQEKFMHILVDEYQDTSYTQYRILKVLSKKHKNLFVVGDEDQSIYGFRGARLENVFDILKDFKDCTIYRLERNYRSYSSILEAANILIKHNKNRIGKNLYSIKGKGDKLNIIECENEREEGEKVYEIIKNYDYKDVLILYRVNAQSRAIEEVFIEKGIPYVVVGALRFYERKEIKDFLSYLKFLLNPYDFVSFERVITAPKRGIGEKTLRKLKNIVDKKKCSVLEGLKEEEFLKSLGLKQKKEIEKIYKSMEYLRENYKNMNILEISQYIYNEFDFVSHLKNISISEENFYSRYQNLEELFSSMREFMLREGKESLEDYMENISVRIDEEEVKHKGYPLMTVHNAKGLESKIVIICGVEEGLFPHFLSLESEKEIEEERRVFYVAITRAKEKVYLLYCKERWRRGKGVQYPSRFLYELPENCIIWNKKDSKNEIRDSFSKGDRVFHPVWGNGIIVHIGDGKAKIKFFKKGYVTFVLKKAKNLRKL